MSEIIGFSLENEMDLVLSHKRSMQVGEKIGLTVATRTTFATAVSEVARTVIDYTDNGTLAIAIEGNFPRFSIIARIAFSSDLAISTNDEGFYYAKRLMPNFDLVNVDGDYIIQMGLGLPRSLKLDWTKISEFKAYFKNTAPLNSYEEIKNRNHELNKINSVQEEELRQRKVLDEKKTEFISVASHELKTPITVIKAYSQMLSMLKDETSEKVREVLEKLNLQTSKLSVLIHQLMDVSRLENGNLQYDFEQIALKDFARETVLMLTSAHPYHQFDLKAEDVDLVMVDKLRLEQVFTNLIGNAVKYSAKGTKIFVTLEKNDFGATIMVQDSGIGMSKKELENIFSKFYRVEEVVSSHPGLGMGLYISSKIVTDHGGKIWAESEPGLGSRFYFTIPEKPGKMRG